MKDALLRLAISAIALVALHVASASALEDVLSGPAFAHVAAVSACDTDGVHVGYPAAYEASTSTHVVGSVALSDIDPDCAGHRAAVTVLDVHDNTIASGTAQITDGVVTIPLSPRPDAAAVSRASFVIGH